ncbi:zinc finger, c4 type (two domains) domain-containing protein [Ditylenchus destructor]|uniref:Zinc finger, c4 type (Two domains) domain-containing protein n=1 Tax=Ditylenchus destructor TaxID=166010 RepID=A0AAD4N5T1_9BILA|nr:zinc finger, c4 type (two domains) domain-containing protein [Ditylenchus destructor]
MGDMWCGDKEECPMCCVLFGVATPMFAVLISLTSPIPLPPDSIRDLCSVLPVLCFFLNNSRHISMNFYDTAGSRSDQELPVFSLEPFNIPPLSYFPPNGSPDSNVSPDALPTILPCYYGGPSEMFDARIREDQYGLPGPSIELLPEVKPDIDTLNRATGINRVTPYTTARSDRQQERKDQKAALLAVNASRCLVCGDLAWNKHFGSLSCNACAAFFRRTVSRQKSYICRRGKNCSLQENEPRHMCRFCRFQRCIQSGMLISAVLAPLAIDAPGSNDSFLKRVVFARRANFVNRVRATVQVYGGYQNMPQMANKHKDCVTAKYAIRAETRVVKEFINSSGLFAGSKIRNVCSDALVQNFFFSWVLVESLLNTTKNVGFRTNQFYFIDESYLQVNEDRLAQYYLTDPNMINNANVARHATEYFLEVLALSAKFHEARLDEEEQAALSLILIISTARQLLNNKTMFSNQLKAVFQDLKTHYEETYDDVAIRMGNVILLLNEFQRVRHLFCEHIIMQKLSGKVMSYEKMTDDNPLKSIQFD